LSPEPVLDYLARDYASFRKLMLDHLSIHAPEATPPNPASLEVALVEVLAYVGDYLSYYQDAVATEAYLATARERVSVRRHARLLDYPLNEGCSARAWLHFEVGAKRLHLSRGLAVATSPGPGDREVFETLHDAVLFSRHNRMAIEEEWNGPRAGDTSARLVGALPNLAAGDVVLLLQTGGRWCQAVRLIDARVEDGGSATKLIWHDEDEIAEDVPEAGPWTVLGNIVLADHGESACEALPQGSGGAEHKFACAELSYAVPYAHGEAMARSAASAMRQDPRRAEPQLSLQERLHRVGDPEVVAGSVWTGRRELLRASRFERAFAVEPDDGIGVNLRFGDGVRGRKPQRGWHYLARYRTGRGSRGNVGPASLTHLPVEDDGIIAVTNPLPARGGADRESIDSARHVAPVAGEVRHRCVTAADYAAAARLFPGVRDCRVQRSVEDGGAVLSMHVARDGERPVDRAFASRLMAGLAPLRTIGDRLRVAGADYVDVVVGIEIAVAPGHEPADVVRGVRRRLIDGISLTFGEALDTAMLVDRAKSVAGVAEARVTALARRDSIPPSTASWPGGVRPRATEIVRIDPAALTIAAEARR
jgi:hypothetical protein